MISKQSLSVFVFAVLAGFVDYLKPLAAGGVLPPQAQWGSILIAALVAAVIGAVHVVMTPPGKIAIDASPSTVAAKSAKGWIPPVPPSSGGFVRLDALFAVLAAIGITVLACSPKQGQILASGIPADATLIGCVIATALGTGGNLAAVAAACATDAETAGAILVQAVETKGLETKAQAEAKDLLSSRPATKEALARVVHAP